MPTRLDVLVLNYFHPWMYAGGERFHQLLREELANGRHCAYVYLSGGGTVDEEVARLSEGPRYSRLAIFKLVDGVLVPVSRMAYESDKASLSELVSRERPRYIRCHFPARGFTDFLRSSTAAGQPVVYDVMDLWSEFDSTPWGECETEQFYLKRADCVTAVSSELATRLATDAKVEVVANAIDREFLQRIRPGGVFKYTTNPKRILYFGTLWGKWIDWETILRLADRCTKTSTVFTLVGPTQPSPDEYEGVSQSTLEAIDRARAHSSVELVDEVPHDDLVPFLRGSDVAIIPFDDSPLARSVSPLKVFEYLGAGIPVVSSRMPSIEGYPGVYTVGTTKEFCEQVERLNKRDLDEPGLRELFGFAANNTWANRVADFDRIVASVT